MTRMDQLPSFKIFSALITSLVVAKTRIPESILSCSGLLGLGGGAFAGAALRHATAATPATVVVASSGGLLGLGMGVGAGLLWLFSLGYGGPS
jgi:uncharacterized membrane protein YsdA (DUF1294 family)